MVDWWALGVIMYECTLEFKPFIHFEDIKLESLIINKEPEFFGTVISFQLRDFI
jgi:serine/threonine kinase 32